MEVCAGVADHIRGVDRLAGRVLGHDFLAVFIDRFGEAIDHVLVLIGGGDQVHRSDVQAVVILGHTTVGATGNGCWVEEIVVPDQRFFRFLIEGDQHDVLRGGRLADGGGGHRAAEEHRGGRTIGQHVHRAGLGGVERGDVRRGDAVRGEDRHHETFKPGTGRADDDALALESRERGDA